MSDKAVASATESFALTFDPTVPFDGQVVRGKYDRVNPHITSEHFKLTLSGSHEVVLFDPRGTVSSQEMVARMKRDRYVPATLDDALALGATHPERQRQNPIVFLGSIWRNPDGDRRLPVLLEWHDLRELALLRFDGGWLDRCRFAAVRLEK